MLLVIAPGLALAKGKPAAPPEETDPRTAAVEDLASRAAERYAAGDFAQAIALTKKAYDITPMGALLYNVAIIYDKKLKERDLAIDYYRRFLAARDADPTLVEKANHRLEVLKATPDPPPPPPPPVVVAPPPVTTPPPTVAPPDESDQRLAGRRLLLLASGGGLLALGVLSIGAGAILGLVAMKDNNDAASLCTGSACGDPRALTLTRDALSAANFSTGCFVAGGLAAAAGAILIVIAPPAKKSRVTLGPQAGPLGSGLVLSGQW